MTYITRPGSRALCSIPLKKEGKKLLNYYKRNKKDILLKSEQTENEMQKTVYIMCLEEDYGTLYGDYLKYISSKATDNYKPSFTINDHKNELFFTIETLEPIDPVEIKLALNLKTVRQDEGRFCRDGEEPVI